MNNTFNLNRFWLYFKKHTIEHTKIYLMSIAVLMGILFFFFGFTAINDNGRITVDGQMMLFMFCLLLGGSIFSSLMFAELGDKKKAMLPLTLPVSHFEKYLVAWLYSYVIFSLVCISSFYLVDYVMLSISKPSGNHNKMLDLLGPITPWYIPFIGYTLFHAFTFWGAIHFKKLHFIKTTFLFFLCLIVLEAINHVMVSLIGNGNIKSWFLFMSARAMEGNHPGNFINPSDTVQYMGFYILATVIVLLWVSTFFKLKEKQV